MPALLQKFPGLRLTIVGCLQGPEAILPTFPAQVREHIDIVPHVPSEEMPEAYAQHDIFLFPSFFEGFPLVLLEAMAGGMPVITAETSGMVDAIRDGWNGLLIPPGDSAAIVRAVVALTESVEMRRSLGRAARETAAWFNWDRIAGILDGVFRVLVPDK